MAAVTVRWRSAFRWACQHCDVICGTPNVTQVFEIQHLAALQFTPVTLTVHWRYSIVIYLFVKRACVVTFNSCYLNIGDNWSARLNVSAFRNVFCAERCVTCTLFALIFLPKFKQAAARSLCDSWASCFNNVIAALSEVTRKVARVYECGHELLGLFESAAWRLVARSGADGGTESCGILQGYTSGIPLYPANKWLGSASRGGYRLNGVYTCSSWCR